MTNYEFCARWVLAQPRHAGTRVLDYGCGAGEIVALLRTQGVDAFGCDVFYPGGDYSPTVPEGLLGSSIRRMENGTIPFPDESVDCVVNNQVMEHAADLDQVLSEIHRVLVPGGAVLSLFPDRGVWREGHSGIPFLHRFGRDNRLRTAYAVALRSLGLGYHKGEKSILRWSRDFCDWLDRWTYYRERSEILGVYSRYFSGWRDLEEFWLQERLGSRQMLAAWLPREVRALIVRKLMGQVFTVQKAPAIGAPARFWIPRTPGAGET